VFDGFLNPFQFAGIEPIPVAFITLLDLHIGFVCAGREGASVNGTIHHVSQ
jgi:hypothetical protein